jgi:enamine deaminase RidA (YjgF/YER057c/UK114 family)
VEGEVSSPHTLVQPQGLAPGRGFSHGAIAEQGRTVWVAGEIASDADGAIVGVDLATQFDRALANVVTVLEAAGARPGHVVSMQIFVTSVADYRRAASDLGPIYRRHFGRHFPAIALVGVTELVEPAALVEIVATAVVPDG